jgi:hypothetical protein
MDHKLAELWSWGPVIFKKVSGAEKKEDECDYEGYVQ